MVCKVHHLLVMSKAKETAAILKVLLGFLLFNADFPVICHRQMSDFSFISNNYYTVMVEHQLWP